MDPDITMIVKLILKCYAMKLELLTNATVVDDAIRFVASHAAAPATTEKANSDESRDKEKMDIKDNIQGSEESSYSRKLQSTATNSIF